MQPWEAAQFGLLADPESLKYQEYADTDLGLLADMTPVIGDIKGAHDFYKEPGLLSGLGLLPFVPNATKIIDLKQGFAVLKNPNKRDLYRLQNDTRRQLQQDTGLMDVIHGDEGLVRWLKQGEDMFAWSSVEATHPDVASWLDKTKDLNYEGKIEAGLWSPTYSQTGKSFTDFIQTSEFPSNTTDIDDWDFWDLEKLGITDE